MGRWRSALGALALFSIFAGAFQPAYWTIFKANRAMLQAWLTERPYSKMPGLRRFMLGVRERTRDGDRIAIVLPARRWEGGYAYGFIRSTYLLAGRQTVPLLSDSDQALPGNIARATHVASWPEPPPPLPDFVAMWSTPDGVLLQRHR
jgi:hypothetical protein